MPKRETKRGEERTPLGGSYDVLICGASFAGLTAARELAGSGARVLILDRYEIGERQTSACAAPTDWLTALGLEESIKQTFGDLVIHTPHTSVRMDLPWDFSTFDYRTLCELLWKQCDADFETATVEGRGAPPNGDARTIAAASPPDTPVAAQSGTAPHIRVVTDRGEIAAPLVVDALGWRRVLGSGANVQPPEARLSRGLEVHPWGSDEHLEIWIERGVVPAGYGWSFPANDELRVGVGSFDPRFHVRQPTVELAERLEVESVRYQGNWIPHRLRPAVDAGVFFAGDSAGHCLPLTAEGIRTAFYFAIACGRELRAVHECAKPRQRALADYAAFSDAHRWKFEGMLRVQQLIPRVPPRLLAVALNGMASKRFVDWSFGHYLNIAPPEFAQSAPRLSEARVAA
ncbi:MAG: NAD(P)/FAD-dependent oxidoreductase [Actinomycetota bacterium]